MCTHETHGPVQYCQVRGHSKEERTTMQSQYAYHTIFTSPRKLLYMLICEGKNDEIAKQILTTVNYFMCFLQNFSASYNLSLVTQNPGYGTV